jgi:hypothetical protein
LGENIKGNLLAMGKNADTSQLAGAVLFFMPRQKNLWVTGASRTEPEGQQQAKTMPDSGVGLPLS